MEKSVINPNNIHCLALNYVGVGEMLEEPLYFVKSKNSICFDGTVVKYTSNSSKMWTEVELGIVLKKDCYNISQEEAKEYIDGFIVCGDVTCENLYGRDHHLGYSKSRKGFCPVSDTIVHLNEKQLLNLELTTIINNKITQKGHIKDMFFNPYQSLAYISKITELYKGDIILTGTPAGVENNIIKQGDIIIHKIDKIGQVSFKVEL